MASSSSNVWKNRPSRPPNNPPRLRPRRNQPPPLKARPGLDLPNGLDEVVLRFIARRQADRFQMAADALEALFGRKVDLIQESAVKNPYLLAHLNQNRFTIYES